MPLRAVEMKRAGGSLLPRSQRKGDYFFALRAGLAGVFLAGPAALTAPPDAPSDPSRSPQIMKSAIFVEISSAVSAPLGENHSGVQFGALLLERGIVKVLGPAANKFLFGKLGWRLARANVRLRRCIVRAHGLAMLRSGAYLWMSVFVAAVFSLRKWEDRRKVTRDM